VRCRNGDDAKSSENRADSDDGMTPV
jgi:hypothetical protein